MPPFQLPPCSVPLTWRCCSLPRLFLWLSVHCLQHPQPYGPHHPERFLPPWLISLPALPTSARLFPNSRQWLLIRQHQRHWTLHSFQIILPPLLRPQHLWQRQLPHYRLPLLHPGFFPPQFHWLWPSFRCFLLPSHSFRRWFRWSLLLSRCFSRWFLIFWLLLLSVPMQPVRWPLPEHCYPHSSQTFLPPVRCRLNFSLRFLPHLPISLPPLHSVMTLRHDVPLHPPSVQSDAALPDGCHPPSWHRENHSAFRAPSLRKQ
ncbi:hypothetical protein BvCmsNSNP012_00944 [Escherichia coli]|nr:hypothetical protein BvCmsNSNP012_00944 [Escherichia coli]